MLILSVDVQMYRLPFKPCIIGHKSREFSRFCWLSIHSRNNIWAVSSGLLGEDLRAKCVDIDYFDQILKHFLGIQQLSCHVQSIFRLS